MDVISIHVLKTAGSTFGKYLNAVYGAERVFLDYNDFVLNPEYPYTADHAAWKIAARAEVRAISPEVRAVHGHTVVEKYLDAFPDARWVTWVRHPASWVISLYYYWKHWPKDHLPFANPLIRRLDAEQLSLIEFAEDPIVRNKVSGLYLKDKPLGEYAFVGIQEHFKEDLHEVIGLMGWPEILVDSVNRSPEPGYAAKIREHREDQRLMDHLVSLNEADMLLYQEAVRLRSRRLCERLARAEKDARKADLRASVRDHHRHDRMAQHA